MNRFKTIGIGTLLFLMVVSLAGCASQMALLRGTASKSYVLNTSDYNAAFSQVAVAAKAKGFSITRENREKGTYFLSRGYGYSEFTNLEVRVAKEDNGNLRIDLVAGSSEGGDSIISEFMNEYRNGIPTK